MSDLANRLAGLKVYKFTPVNQNSVSNPFQCLLNFDVDMVSQGEEGRGETMLYVPVFRKLNESLGVHLSLAKLAEDERVVEVEQLVKLNR